MPTEKGLYKLNIDKEFKRFIPPLSIEERKQLEENILQDGCRDALVIWKETIIDGHNRYAICTEHQIPFKVDKLEFGSREAAISWICANQLGRRNISEITRRYLIGKRYDMEKPTGIFNVEGINQYSKKEVGAQNEYLPKANETATKTSERLGKEYRIAPATVQRYSWYATALDRIAKESPELYERVLSGEVKITQEKIVEISRLPSAEICRIEAELPKDPSELARYMDACGLIPRNTPNKVQLSHLQIGAIKDMPVYDPDAEVLSLSWTIPSWIGSVNRVRASAKFNEISSDAREKIKTVLSELNAAINEILFAVEEKQ